MGPPVRGPVKIPLYNFDLDFDSSLGSCQPDGLLQPAIYLL